MSRSGCAGLTFGSLLGLLVVVLFVLLTRPGTPPPDQAPATIAPDMTVFISEQSLSRIATELLRRPAVIDFDVNGEMHVITRIRVGRFSPVVRAGFLLYLEGTEVVSQLRWVRLGFLTVPASWLPPDVLADAALAGQAIKSQTPPDFSLIGLTTTPDGVTFLLKWTAR